MPRTPRSSPRRSRATRLPTSRLISPNRIITNTNGFTNRVPWPILHYRLDLAEFSRRDLSGYLRVNDHIARELDKALRPDDLVWVHDLIIT